MADLEQVIGDAVEDAGDIGAEDPTPTEDTGGTTDGGGTPPPEDDPFAKEHGLTAKRADGRENRIPYSRVKAINERAIQKAKAEWESAQQQVQQELAALRAYRQQLAPFESVVDVDGERMIRALAQRNPQQYGRFLEALEAKAQQAQTQQRAQQDPMPQPDYDLGNGNMTYSAEGFQKLREWDRREAVREAEEKIAKRLQPIEEDRQAAHKYAQEKQRQRQIVNEVGAQVDKTLAKVRQLPGFEQNEEAILAAYQADPTSTVHDAYLKVMLPKFQQGKTQMRSAVLQEIQQTPRKTSEGAGSAVDERDKPQSIEDIIRASVAGLK